MKVQLINLFLVLPLMASSQLTGYWQTENGGCYQITQKGNEVWWAGETSGDTRATNVFHGFISGNILIGQWCDMPSSSSNNCETTLALRIDNNNQMTKLSSSSSYNGNIWTRTQGGCGVWMALHEHRGCSMTCTISKTIPIGFSSLQEGEVIKITPNNSDQSKLRGTLNGLTLTYTYNAGSPGRGEIVFAPDFRSFTGTFEDDAGHRGIWKGWRK